MLSRTVPAALLLGLMVGFVSAPPAFSQGTDTVIVDFFLNVDPFFEIEVEGDADIGPITFEEKSFTKTVRVKVRTNVGQKYGLVHRLEQPLQNEQGDEFPREKIFLTVSDGLHGGKALVHSPAPLSLEPIKIFSSDPTGKSDEFTLAYTISGSNTRSAGDYHARIIIEKDFL